MCSLRSLSGGDHVLRPRLTWIGPVILRPNPPWTRADEFPPKCRKGVPCFLLPVDACLFPAITVSRLSLFCLLYCFAPSISGRSLIARASGDDTVGQQVQEICDMIDGNECPQYLVWPRADMNEVCGNFLQALPGLREARPTSETEMTWQGRFLEEVSDEEMADIEQVCEQSPPDRQRQETALEPLANACDQPQRRKDPPPSVVRAESRKGRLVFSPVVDRRPRDEAIHRRGGSV